MANTQPTSSSKATSELNDLEANKKVDKNSSLSKLRAITFRFIPICGAILVVFSLGGGIGYAFNGKPLPRDAVVGISVTFLILGILFGLGCLKLYHRRSSQPPLAARPESGPDVARQESSRLKSHMTRVFTSKSDLEQGEAENVEEFLERGRRDKRKPQRGTIVEVAATEADETGEGLRPDRSRIPRQPTQQAAPRTGGAPQVPSSMAQPMLKPQTLVPESQEPRYSWEIHDGIQVHTAQAANRNIVATQDTPKQVIHIGLGNHAGQHKTASSGRDESAKNLPKRTQATRRRDTPHPQTNAVTLPQRLNPLPGPGNEDPDRLAYDIVKMSGMARTQADLRGDGEPILPRSSSKKKTEPVQHNQIPGSETAGMTRPNNHMGVNHILGVGPVASRLRPSYSQPAFIQDPFANNDGGEQGTEAIHKLQQPKQEYGRSLTTVDEWQVRNNVMNSAPEWI
ncbi:hypothetical protein PFICI_08320 [Pestalotiopsis fici W106-1]|uniref:Uncharacterized protein n=1 Tax=Pestalotiopsis fici (strain W106-1 / CGMCC3.15140) TaxID=1229662 RepID=W3X6J5_PESFW|nr:uncharacterized protein PFICI_08320 [Pestalotiopsis fici W106-1]ETS80791.1 hypothetical protein PFICI_08320 [Pestalotiopsis fici W106-1]